MRLSVKRPLINGRFRRDVIWSMFDFLWGGLRSIVNFWWSMNSFSGLQAADSRNGDLYEKFYELQYSAHWYANKEAQCTPYVSQKALPLEENIVIWSKISVHHFFTDLCA